MKEATGELNMTVVTVVAIVAVGAFFYAFIWPGIQDSIAANTICANGLGYESGETSSSKPGFIKCDKTATNGAYTCKYSAEDPANPGKYKEKTARCKVTGQK